MTTEQTTAIQTVANETRGTFAYELFVKDAAHDARFGASIHKVRRDAAATVREYIANIEESDWEVTERDAARVAQVRSAHARMKQLLRQAS